MVSAGNPSGSFHSPPPFAQGRLSPLGDYKLSPRRAGVLAKPCKRLRPAARRPPTRPKIPLPAFISFAPGMHGSRKKPSDCFPLASERGAKVRRDSSGAFVRPWKKGQKPGRFRRTLLLDRPGPAAIMGNRGGEKYGPFEPGKTGGGAAAPHRGDHPQRGLGPPRGSRGGSGGGCA